MELIFSKAVIVALAVLGAVLSMIALPLRDRLGAAGVRWLNVAGYGFMTASMLLFIAAGFRA